MDKEVLEFSKSLLDKMISIEEDISDVLDVINGQQESISAIVGALKMLADSVKTMNVRLDELEGIVAMFDDDDEMDLN